ncbi:MAG: redoxin domain-containing protein [Planctomycetes bacterium]|nr:redoxin domain-containing protein [Planctomycetota bacterium]
MKTGSRNGRLGWTLLFGSSAVALCAVIGGCSETRLTGVDLDGNRVDLFGNRNAKAVVLIFVNTDCPISNRYAPEIQRLQKEYDKHGVTFWLVYPLSDESSEDVKRHLAEYGYSFGALRDPDRELVRRSRASKTPEAAVFVPDGKRVYHGRIDNRYVDFGQTRVAATQHDLEDVLEAVIAEQPINVAATKAIGCSIPDAE